VDHSRRWGAVLVLCGESLRGNGIKRKLVVVSRDGR